MIIVITGWFQELDYYGLPTGKERLLVSHGVDTETDKLVILPQVPIEEMSGLQFDPNIGEYVL